MCVRAVLVYCFSLLFSRNVMSDFGGEVMAEVLAERALVRPQIIPLVPLTNQYRHQDHMDLKDFKSKVWLTVSKQDAKTGLDDFIRMCEKFIS